ncbi:MAG: 6-phosphogluconolactonase [Acidobacteria bacterium]|nr:6-phosphogluconolactonase [Acidobacteriota bacterium]
MSVQKTAEKNIGRRLAGNNVWLGDPAARVPVPAAAKPFEYKVLPDEEAVGRAMLAELIGYSEKKTGDIVIVLLGGRGAQAMYKLIAEKALGTELDELLGRLHVFTQDALAPMRMDNGLSFVRDFERLLGDAFFAKIKSFTPMNTESGDVEAELGAYLDRLAALGGIDIFFLGFGPEAEAASHLCYIKPNSGARAGDVAGVIPISASILEHHINKFKVGGSRVSPADEAECRRATSILTLGPAAILGAKKIVQSIVDAATAPGKIPSFKRFLETELAAGEAELAAQCDENPGLWIRLHDDVKSFVLPDLLS